MKLAVFVKTEGAMRREDRPLGYFSYALDPALNLKWEFFAPGKRFTIKREELARQGFGAIVHEDYGCAGEYVGDELPLIFLDIDSTLSEYHRETRIRLVRQAALVLVDQAPLDQFSWHDVPIYRFPHCVNDRVFMPSVHGEGPRTTDVAFHENKGDSMMRQLLAGAVPELVRSLGYSSSCGTVGLDVYARNLAAAKVAINWPRVPTNRPHRVFDAMAAGTALLTGPLPEVDGDGRQPNYHYWTFRDMGEAARKLRTLIGDGEWQVVAERGQALVRERHTWATRAQQLRTILEQTGLWKDGHV